MNVGLNARKRRLRNKSKGNLTYNQRRRHLRPPVMRGSKGCLHSLAKHDEIAYPNGTTGTITYALPCIVKQHRNPKKAVHKDTTGRTWR